MRPIIAGSWVSLALLLTGGGAASADLVFKDPVVDLGEIRTGEPLEHRFTFTNNGRSSIEIVETRASCGCLNPELNPKVLQPGEKGTLVLKVHTLSAPVGRHLWQVQMKYATLGMVHESTLQLHAHVLQEILVQPPALIIYGEKAIDHEITLTDLRSRPLSVRGVETTSAHLKACLVDSGRNPRGQVVHKFKLTVPEDLPQGRHDEQAVIHTDDERYRELRVPVSVIKRAKQRYMASPADVSVVASRLQPSPSRTVHIRDAKGQPVIIERVMTDHAAIVCDWAADPQSTAKVKITIDGKKLAGKTLEGQVKVYVKQQAEPVTIPVTCAVR